MATIKASEIRQLTEKEILEKIYTFDKDLYGFMYHNQTGRVEKPHKMRELKKNIAKCYTILREKQNA